MPIQIIHIILILMMTNQVSGQLKIKKVNDLPKQVYETSGLVYYQDKYLITHNDGGHKSEIFVFNLKGELKKTINIVKTKNRDWEDLTQDNEGRIYIGDFGNNRNNREKCQIYILPKNFIDKKKVEPKKITFWYEDQKKFPPDKSNWNYDCEAFFWKDDKLYLFTKCRTKPYTGDSKIYVIPATAGKHKAKHIGTINLGKMGWRFSSVTSIDYDPNSNSIAILTYTKLFVLSKFKKNAFWSSKIKSYSLPMLKQREAICFKDKNNLFMTDEYKKGLGGGNLYTVKLK